MVTGEYLELNGNKASKHIKETLKKEVDELLKAGHRAPHLVAILVGENGASKTYVGMKEKACEAVGIKSTLLRFDVNLTEADLLNEIAKINKDDSIDGLIVQLPLPNHINENNVTEAIDPTKDVDGFHNYNMGKLAKGNPGFISATPYGITKLLEFYNIETAGKHCVIVGRSNIVGRPMSLLMSMNASFGNSTVTLCHSRTVDMKKYCLMADILIVALGKPDYITADMVKEGAVVIDVGITRVETDNEKGYVIKGDVNFEDVAPKTSAITPVPRGVGPMTIVGLLENTVQAYKQKNNL